MLPVVYWESALEGSQQFQIVQVWFLERRDVLEVSIRSISSLELAGNIGGRNHLVRGSIS